MTPHGVLENMAALKEWGDESEIDSCIDKDIWSETTRLLTDAVHFEFNRIVADDIHGSYAVQLASERKLLLPHDVVLYTGEGHFWRHGCLATILGDDLRIIEIRKTEMKNGEFYDLPFMAATLHRFHEVHRHELSYRFAWDVGRSPNDDDEKIIWGVVGAVFDLTGLLMSHGVRINIERAPERLNKARLAKGRVPVRERRVVIIRTQDLHGKHVAAGTDKRASPTPHWRRAHVQRRPSGKVVMIPPTIVGAKDDHIPVPKSYIVDGT